MIKAVLFDLDGTLLPMDLDEFFKEYMIAISKRFAPLGYDAKSFTKNLWKGVQAIVFNNGEKTNEEAFWDCFSRLEKVDDSLIKQLEEFYEVDFPKLKNICGYTEKANMLIKKLKNQGYTLVLATKPIFPAVATETRMAWAGVDKNDFSLITSYHNSTYSKPNPDYYREILSKIELSADECIMVGNDTKDDGEARKAGIKTYILTDYLINNDNLDLNDFPHGNFDDLLAADIQSL